VKRKKQRPVHARIKKLRGRRGLTQGQLAEMVGTDKGSVCHWERGNYAPNGESLRRLASALGVTIDDLYGDAA